MKIKGYIGMRTVKTLIAVYICFMIGMLRNILPFYSAIAAILCIKKDFKEGKKVGIHRMIGTLVGGSVGLFALLLFRQIINVQFGVWHYLLITFGIIPVIYINVFLKSKEAVFIGCVVYLSVTISHGGDHNPYLFTINRVVDTMLGIGIAWLVDAILPASKEE